ncbi:M48 family metalloprotease [uncultured Bartonella sp.]|uniref:M48 family metalloprotease n=1 Tax=uncultured Bartonella sp. TaxID=104108 RepID=UPI0034379427
MKIELQTFRQNVLSFIKQSINLFLHCALALLLVIAPTLQVAQAQSQSVPVIRDAEIEQLLADYTAPIFKAAGVKNKIQIIIVNDQSFNAFVDGQRMFVNIGALMTAETPNEIIGVIAHETGHLANGHQQRLREQLKRAQTMAVIGMLLGIGAGIAGASTGNTSAAGAGGGIAAGSNEMAMRTLLNYQRSEESAADRAAVNYLNATGQSTKGMLITFERFSSALALSGSKPDPYRISHPLPRERIAALETLAKQSPYYDKKDPPELQLRHDMARAKIAAYTGHFTELRRMFKDNPRGLPARYGEAILAVHSGSPKNAVVKVKDLIKDEPKNPFFQELLGDALIKANDPAGAASAYKRSAEIDPRGSSLLRINYGHALLLTNDPKNVPIAINEIRDGIAKEPEFAAGYGYLALAYGRSGQVGLADLATADMHYYSGNRIEARIFATRAQQKLSPKSAEWLRAQDILNTTQLKKR